MATIEKMMLCGLRNFGPYEEDLQSVKFASPLTLFLGENGCGKTTLIEALKFACSGELPGGTKSGQGFVHDPRLHSTSSTKGQVRLKFSDARGNKFIVCKIVQVINKGATSSFKRLDSTLKRINADGTHQAISSRCADIDNEICEILGVSKAILNNVIFCHQEDAAWPLDEPKKLKEKFDEIFGATEYNKCIETIRKTIKDQTLKNKDLQLKVGLLEQTKHIADKKKAEMQEKNEKLAHHEGVIKEKENRLVPITTRLQEICDLEINLSKLQQQYTEKETIKKSLIQQQQDILKHISDEYSGSDEDLQKEISSFESNREKTEEKRKTLEEKRKSEEVQKNRIFTLIDKSQIKMGKLQNEKKLNQNNIVERNGFIAKLSQNLSVQVTTEFETNDMVLIAINTVNTAIEDFRASLEKLTVEFDKEESQLQEAINTCRDDLSKTNHSIDSKNLEIREIKGKTRDINSQLRELDYSDEQLKSLQAKILRMDGDLKNLKSSFDVDVASKNIEIDKQKMREYEEKLEVLEREYKTLQQNSITEAELETQKHEIIKRESEIHKLKNTHFETFNKIFGDEIPDPGFIKNSVENEKQRNNSKINELNNKIAAKQRETTTLEAKCKFQKEKLEIYQNEFRENEKQVFELCKDKSFDVMSNELHQTIEKLQKHKGQFSSAKIMYEKFIQEFQGEKSCCPVCETDFMNKQGAVNRIVGILRSKIQGIPQELKKIEEQLKTNQEQYSKVLQLKPVSDRIEELSVNMIPKAKSDFNELNKICEKVSNELANFKEELIKPQSIVDACNKVIGDSALIDQHQVEINRSRRKITDLESQLVQVPSNRSRQQAEAEIEDLKVDLSNIRRNCEASQKKLQQHNDRCQELREERSKLVEKQLQIQKAMQGKPQLQDQLTELTQKEEVLKTEVTELQMQMIPLKLELKDAENAKETVKANNRKKLDESRRKVNENQKILDNIKRLQKLVEDYITKNIDGIYESTLEELTNFRNNVKSLEENIAELNNKITEVNKQLVSQEAAFRNLKDNLNLRQKRKDVEELSNEIANLKRQIGDFNYRTVLTEKQKLRDQEDEIRREVNVCKGRNDVLQQEIKKLQTELNLSENKNAHTNYKKAFIEFTCAKKMTEELELYMKALERGLMEFHKERMAQINKIIRHLWRSIYRGNDCDYIEIKTDETKTSTVRRTYNYKVVQIKNDVEIDMRGRCSAGQKVLACLVIRMALAETFSKNCGILALDEPTTNLDRKNITSLSEALARIVNTRQSEKNFQLLVITHDEEFLSVLKTRVDKVSHFWRVSRNERGNSVITREML